MSDILDRLQTHIHVESAAMSPAVSPLMADLTEARDTIQRMRDALTPSGETKGAYMGEFSVRLPVFDAHGHDTYRHINVPWTVIKEIMKAIKSHAEGGA